MYSGQDPSGLLAPTHAAYLTVSVLATVWVARTLRKHGQLFLADTFPGKAELADAVNQLLVTGFYLVNIGWVCLNVANSGAPQTVAQVLEVLGTQVGEILLMLGVMHFFNLYVFSRIRRRALIHKAPPPVFPAQMISPPRAA